MPPEPPPPEPPAGAPPPAEDVELAVVAGLFAARPGEEATLAGVLARYVVLTRAVPGCRNVDLVTSLARPGRFLVVEKWVDAEAQRAHADGPVMLDMASAAVGLLAGPPDLDLYAAISAQDLEAD